jgi:hypothetical protein
MSTQLGVRSHATSFRLGLAGVLAFGGIAFSASAADAADVPCGTPAVEAVYETVHHAEVPAVYEAVEVTPARPARDEVIHHEAVPAVFETDVITPEVPAYDTSIEHAAIPPVYETWNLWSNPPGGGNTANPGQGEEQGEEEQWVKAARRPRRVARRVGAP